jgi:hypothetical protein
MKTALLIIAILVIIGMSFHAIRYFKLRSLQMKRNACDLSTEKGRYAARQYNKRINKLMNFSDTDTAGGHN